MRGAGFKAPRDWGKAWLLALPLAVGVFGGAIRSAEGRHHVFATGIACFAMTAAIVSALKVIARDD